MRQLVEGLHSCTDLDLFDELWAATKEVLLHECSVEMQAYVKYFEKQWLNSRFKNWKRGNMRPGYLVTNNTVEQQNREVKRTYFRGRVSLSELLKGSLVMVEHESRDQKEIVQKAHFCTITELEVVRRKAIELSTKRGAFVKEGDVWRVQHLTRRAAAEPLPRLCEVVLRVKQYKVHPGTADDPCTCTCPYYYGKLVCKHLLGLRFGWRIVNVLPAAVRRAPGRPKNP